jgi:hypothetical protein
MEEIPREWMQGLIFPLYKDGDDRDPLNYRGITLLSIVGKVYNRVLGDRLMKFAERKGGVLEEQESDQELWKSREDLDQVEGR